MTLSNLMVSEIGSICHAEKLFLLVVEALTFFFLFNLNAAVKYQRRVGVAKNNEPR